MTKFNSIRGFDNKSKGERFEKEIAESWQQVPKSWRLRIRDGGGGDRPGDEIVVLDKFRLLCELKCTNKKTFSMSLIRPGQIQGLMAFSKCNRLNLGLVFIKFEYTQELFIVHIFDLMKWISMNETLSISRNEFDENILKNIKMERCKDIWNFRNINEALDECYN